MKPKIAIFLYSLAGGGAERVVSILLQNLSTTHNITLVLMNQTIVYDIPKNIPIYLLESSSPDESGILKLLKLPFLAWKYQRFCTQSGITVSFSLMNRPNYINILSKLFGNSAGIIISERGTPSRQYAAQSLQGRINRFLIRHLYPKADLITTNSLGNSEDLKHTFCIKKPISVLYNLFDIEAIQNSIKTSFKQNKYTFTLITVGRLDEGKNHLLLLEALSKLNRTDMKLIIIGEGPLKNRLHSAIKKHRLETQVELIGFINNPFAYLAQADIFLFASRHEGFPNVIVEALACRCAVISTDCPSGPREILAPGTSLDVPLKNAVEYAEYGVLTPVDNGEQMANALQTLLDNPSLLQNYREKSILRAKDFDKTVQLPLYENLLNSTCARDSF